MAYVIYPKCNADDIRKKEVDSASLLSTQDLKRQPKGNYVCSLCSPEKRVIANGNVFDFIEAKE